MSSADWLTQSRWGAAMRGMGLAAGPLLLTGCGRKMQSALDPAGTASRQIAGIWWLLFWMSVIVFTVTMLLLVIGITRRSREAPGRPPMGGIPFVVLSGIIIPAVILLGLLVASLRTTVSLKVPPNQLTVQVVGHQWWWEIHYPGQGITTANEIQIPTGQPVRLELTSKDVIHSFWVPNLNGKMDLIPGHPNEFWIAADRPGTYRGQCAEYCGMQHAHMAFSVVAMPPGEFQEWVRQRQQPTPQPADPHLSRGELVFFQSACHDCHAIGGTPAKSDYGPDLTHIGSRLTLGAGTLANTTGNLEGWIADAQSSKPGIRMPRMFLPPDDLHDLRAYLQSLK